MGTSPRARKVSRLKPIPRGIWMLGLVSLLMDTSSELIHSLLPVFLVSTLGASVLAVGLIEGTAEATAAIVKVFSGALSDYIRRRKLLTVIGYGLAAATKPFFPLAQSVAVVFGARFVDRIGKGIRGAPRDALIGELAPPDSRGASYGLRQALDTVGAFAGPLLAIACMALFAGDIRAVFWVASVPAVLAVAVLALGVREPARTRQAGDAPSPVPGRQLLTLGARFWWLVAIATLLTLGRFSEAFLILRAEDAGLAIAFVPLVLVAMNVAYALSAYPAGLLSDRVPRTQVLAVACVSLIGADLVLAAAEGVWSVMLGVLLWGLHLGLSQGVLAALVADATPERLRGTAFGAFHLVTGVAMLAASALAGFLWDRYAAPATFVAGAVFTLAALAGIVVHGRRSPA